MIEIDDFLCHRLYEKLSEVAEQRKADFADFEQQDVKCREDLKHTKERQKKLIKSLEKEKAKVSGQVQERKTRWIITYTLPTIISALHHNIIVGLTLKYILYPSIFIARGYDNTTV